MSLAPSLTPDATENAEENAESRTPDAKENAEENAESRILAAKDYYDVLGVGPSWTASPVNAARRASFLSLASQEECWKAYCHQLELICPDERDKFNTQQVLAQQVLATAWEHLVDENTRKEYTKTLIDQANNVESDSIRQQLSKDPSTPSKRDTQDDHKASDITPPGKARRCDTAMGATLGDSASAAGQGYVMSMSNVFW